MSVPRASLLAAVGLSVVASAALLAGCGSSDTSTTATRAATGSASCPEQRGSEANYFTFMNDLDTDVTLSVPRASWSCDGYSGVSTPGNLDGRVIGHPGPQPRIRMERYLGGRPSDTAFTMAVKAGGATLATVDMSSFLYPGPMYPWGIEIDGRYTCYRPVVDLKGADGARVGYLTMTKKCLTSASGDVVIHLTKIEPWK